ncbi:MAG: GGDEF domain-containing protein [Bacillota bacterium]
MIDKHPDPPTTWWRRLLHWGASIGGGWVLLQFPVRFEPGVLLAFHGVAPALSGLYGGPLWGIVTAVPVAIYRYWIGGAGGLPGAFHLLAAGLVAGILALGGRGFTLPMPQLLWRSVLIFLVANFSLLMIPERGPELFREYFVLLTVSHATVLMVAIWILRNRFVARLNLEVMTDRSLTDHLTGLPNLRAFEEAVAQLDASETGAFLLMDVDHFKQVNDEHGHLNGDLVLQRVAQILRSEVRQTDLVCRYGGEEFAVLMRNCPTEKAKQVAERIRLAIEQTGIATGRGMIRITVSGGLVPFTGGLDFRKRFAEADYHLYRAKRLGRNRIESAS